MNCCLSLEERAIERLSRRVRVQQGHIGPCEYHSPVNRRDINPRLIQRMNGLPRGRPFLCGISKEN